MSVDVEYTPSARVRVPVLSEGSLDYLTIPDLREPVSKRLLDISLAAIGILLSCPLWVLIALLIKLEDGGPIFYCQKRWGKRGKVIVVRKFRTMVPDSDREGIKPAADNDPRVTRVGRVLRAMGLDELPQLLSILWGDMSLVGPRALAVGEVIYDRQGRPLRYEDIPEFALRLAVKPGLTSLATIYLPKDAPPRRKFRYDLLYIRKRSLWLDIRLIALSLLISLLGRWETRQPKL